MAKSKNSKVKSVEFRSQLPPTGHVNLGKSLNISMLYPRLQHKLIITGNYDTMRTKSANACLKESLIQRSARDVLVMEMTVMMVVMMTVVVVLVLMVMVMVMMVVMMDIILY